MVSEIDTYEAEAGLRTKILIIGSVVGAGVGLLGAYIFLNSMQKNKGELNISPGEGIRLGLILTALLRNIYEIPVK